MLFEFVKCCTCFQLFEKSMQTFFSNIAYGGFDVMTRLEPKCICCKVGLMKDQLQARKVLKIYNVHIPFNHCSGLKSL